MVEEYKRLRQRDSTGGSVGMATHPPMGNVVPTSCTLDVLFFPSLPSLYRSTPSLSPSSLLTSSLFILVLFPLLFPPSSSHPLSSPFLPPSFIPLPPLRDHKIFMEDYCASVGEHDTSLRGHGTHALHRRGQETTCDGHVTSLEPDCLHTMCLFLTWLR